MNCQFSLNHYVECIELAEQEGYKIKRVCDYNNEDKKVILLRHDIDFSLKYALELAKLEYQIGIKSSYYVYLHSWGYNALAPESMDIIKKISKMGHEIGLHYDSRYLLHCEGNIIHDLIHEKEITFSQHNPGMTDKLNNDVNSLPLKYISDSGRNWREGCMCEHIGKHNKLHILVHPIWWVGKSRGGSRDETIFNLILDEKNHLDHVYKDIVKQMKDYCRDLGIEYY